MTILDLNAPGYTMLQWLTILLENREFDTSSPLAAEAKEYLMNTFHLDYKSADIIIGYRADDSYFSFASDFINGAISYRQLCNAITANGLVGCMSSGRRVFKKDNPMTAAIIIWSSDVRASGRRIGLSSGASHPADSLKNHLEALIFHPGIG